VVEPLRAPLRFGSFLAASIVFDLALVLFSWCIALPLLARLRLSLVQNLLAAALLALFAPLAFLYVRYQLSRFMGDLLDPSLLLAWPAGSPVEWLAQGSAHLVPVAGAIAATLAAAVLLVRALRANAMEARLPTALPAAASALSLCALTLAASAVILPAFCLRGGAGCEALERKASGLALTQLSQLLTDFDFDGWGLASRPIDQAPFDGARHPFALDVPGNGLDENGLAGDHPVEFAPPADAFVEKPVFARSPNVLLVFLEGMRADVLGARSAAARSRPT